MRDTNIIRRTGRALRGLAVAAAAVAVLAGCDLDRLLEVEDRDRVTEETLVDPGLVDVLVAGAFNDFTIGYGGDDLSDAYVVVSAALTDELFSAGTFEDRTATDRRASLPPARGNVSDDAYNWLHFARRSIRQATAALAEHRPEDEAYSELRALEGYTLVALGEGFCSAVPLSEVVDGEYQPGEPQTSAQLLERAIGLFDAALEAGAGPLADVGKARALLDLGRYDEAAAAVAGVDTDYAYHVHYSVSGANNPLFSLQSNGRWSQSDHEGQWDDELQEYTGTGLPFREAMDPRTPWWEDPDGGFDDDYRLFVTDRYTYYDSPLALASGVEARLIEAEAALQAGDYAGMTSILNGLRLDVDALMEVLVPEYPSIVEGTPFEDATLAPLDVPTSAADARDALFRERGFWLYLTGHRLGDLRRLVYQYDHNAYPAGAYHKGGNFGADVVLPIDFDEINNEHFDLEMCDLTDAGID